jgi:hypothetical protein
MRVTVGHFICVDSSGKALDSPPCIARLTEIFEMVAFLILVANSVQSSFFGNF